MEAKFVTKGPKKSNQSSNLTSQRMVTESRFMTHLYVPKEPRMDSSSDVIHSMSKYTSLDFLSASYCNHNLPHLQIFNFVTCQTRIMLFQ